MTDFWLDDEELRRDPAPRAAPALSDQIAQLAQAAQRQTPAIPTREFQVQPEMSATAIALEQYAELVDRIGVGSKQAKRFLAQQGDLPEFAQLAAEMVRLEGLSQPEPGLVILLWQKLRDVAGGCRQRIRQPVLWGAQALVGLLESLTFALGSKAVNYLRPETVELNITKQNLPLCGSPLRQQIRPPILRIAQVTVGLLAILALVLVVVVVLLYLAVGPLQQEQDNLKQEVSELEKSKQQIQEELNKSRQIQDELAKLEGKAEKNVATVLVFSKVGVEVAQKKSRFKDNTLHADTLKFFTENAEFTAPQLTKLANQNPNDPAPVKMLWSVGQKDQKKIPLMIDCMKQIKGGSNSVLAAFAIQDLTTRMQRTNPSPPLVAAWDTAQPPPQAEVVPLTLPK